MDPTATWKLFLDCLVEEEFAEAKQHLTNLREWLKKGGAPPDGMTYPEAWALVQYLRK